MSGIAKSIGKTFSRVSSSNVGKGLLAAAAIYYIGGMATGSFSGTDAGVAGADGVAPGGGDESAGLNMNAPGASDESAGLATTAMPTPAPDVPDVPAAPGASPTPDVPASTPDASSSSAAAPAAVISPAPAPAPTPPPAVAPATVSPGATPAPSSTSVPVASPAGSVKTATLPAGAQTMRWFQNLSPGAQAALAGGAAGGASALMNALAMRHQEEFVREREDRSRQDIIRRGAVPGIADGAITRSGPGIIDSLRRGT